MQNRNRQRGSTVLNAALVLALATAGTAGAVVYNAGSIQIQVREKHEGGENINLIIPAAIIPVGLAFAPDEKLAEVSERMQEILPILKAAAEELEKIPDGVLVEVRNHNEHVLIEKRGGALVIDVDTDSEEVHISFPIHMLISAVRKLESVRPDPEDILEARAETYAAE